MAGATARPTPEHLHLPLFPADRELPPLDDVALARTADYFLPRLLKYRLDYAHKVKTSTFAVADLSFPTRELACKLGACVQGDADLALRLVSLLQAQNDVGSECNVDCALVEVIWPRLHSNPSQTRATQMKIEAELTAEVNTFLLSCGETRQYSREEIGIRVASLGLATKRTNGGSVLLICNETNRRIHQLARGYGIGKKVLECFHCQPAWTATA